MAGRKKKPFTKKPNVGRPFDKQGKLADLIRALSGKKMPFDKSLKMQKGGEAKKKMTVPTPKPKGSEMNEILAMREQRKLNPYSNKDRARLRKQPVGKKDGGAVPAKFKGFSKLPEKVQQKMNPDLAQKYEDGGEVRGARSAISGRGFKGIR